jgi:hypothetical protein
MDQPMELLQKNVSHLQAALRHILDVLGDRTKDEDITRHEEVTTLLNDVIAVLKNQCDRLYGLSEEIDSRTFMIRIRF